MPSKARVAEFRGRLLSWYRAQGRHFPWRRRSASRYELVVAEVLLQRTRAETVAGFFRSFVRRYPSWRALARATEPEMEEFLKPIGLWRRRARSLVALARAVGARGGRFPRRREEIENLPAVGQYVANAVELFCHGLARPLLDGNMARVLERVFGPRKLADIRYDPYLQALAREVVDADSAREVNWAVLDLAALVCRGRAPRCGECPVLGVCREGRARLPAAFSGRREGQERHAREG